MANLSKEQFDVMKADLLIIYDQLKDLKRDASRKSRDFDFDSSYVQRNEQTIESLESRKKDLSASVEQKAKERVTLSEDSLDYFNDKILSLTKQLEDKNFEFGGYDLTYSQNAFVSSVNQFADEIQAEFGSVKEKFDMNYQNSAMTVKYEDKDAKFEKQVNKMYEKFYEESAVIKKNLESHQDSIAQLEAEIAENVARHEADTSKLKAEMDAAKAAENHDLVKKIAEDMKMKQADFEQWYDQSRRELEYNQKEVSYYAQKEDRLNMEVEELVAKVREGINQGRKFGGKVATIEEIYALGITNFDSGVDLKAADAEVRQFKTELEAFDQAAATETEMFEKDFKAVLSELGIKQAQIVKVEQDLKALPEVIAENNDKIAMLQNDIAKYRDSLDKYKADIDGLFNQKDTLELELAGLPVDADPALIAKYEAAIADITVTIESIEGKAKSVNGNIKDAIAAEEEANTLIDKSQAELAEAQAIEGELKASYDALKAEFNDSNIKRAQDVAAKEEQRKAKIDAIIAAEEAQSVADKFKAKYNLAIGDVE